MSKRRNDQFWLSASMNDMCARRYYNQLMELSLSMFEWKNLPETIDYRFLELTLFADGKSLFFMDEDIGYLSLRVALSGGFNVYNIPINRRAYAVNGYNAKRTIDNSVIIYNNLIHTNTMPIIENFAIRLWTLDRIADVNCNAQKTPLLIVCDENMRLTMENLYMKYEGNEPVIFGDKRLTPESIEVLKTDAPFVADKILQYKTNVWNEALTFLGISNITLPKKENLVKDEVENSQGGVIANRYSRLQARKQACEQINEMFGLNIDVDYRDDGDKLAKEMENEAKEEGGD